MIESKKRSLIKAITWRILAIIVLTIVTWLFTSNVQATAFVVISFNVIQIILYYFHERLWERVKWGRKSTSRKRKRN